MPLLALAIAGFLFWPRSAEVPSRAPAAVATAAPPVIPPRPPRPRPAPQSIPLPVPLTAAPAAASPAAVQAPAPAADHPDGGPSSFGPLVALGQGYAFAEALQKNAAHAEAYIDKLCAESAKLREKGPMKPPQSRSADAAEYMAPLVDFEKPFDQPPGRLHLSEELRQHLTAGPGTDWGAKITDADLAALDFSWLTALARFDHWTVMSAGRLKAYTTDDFFSFPIPNYISLMQWAKLRYALARRRGDHASASAEVRHLADLIRSNNLLIAEAIAVALYRIDAGAREAAAGADIPDWPALDGSLLDTQRHVAFASMYFTYPGVKPETLRRAMQCVPMPCVALVEGVGANKAFGSYGGDNLAVVTELAASNGCEKALIGIATSSRDLPAADAIQRMGDDLYAQIPRHLGPDH